jgi:hypothetical protein
VTFALRVNYWTPAGQNVVGFLQSHGGKDFETDQSEDREDEGEAEAEAE